MKLKIEGKGNVLHLIKMLAYIEWCGNIGHTPKALKVYIDGDGATRFRFKFKNEDNQQIYEDYKKDITEKWNKEHKDLEFIEL